MLLPIFIRYQGLRKLYGQLFLPLLEKYALTQLEADILLFLANNPGYDTARDMVETRRLAKSHVSAGIDSLVERGLLERFWLEGNRKTIHLRLTDEASPIIAEGRAAQRQYGMALFAGFAPEEQAELFRLLNRVSENVDAALADGRGRPEA